MANPPIVQRDSKEGRELLGELARLQRDLNHAESRPLGYMTPQASTLRDSIKLKIRTIQQRLGML